MIPIKLTLQGIYSYQEKQTIDFTKLTEANIFGIFGSVGSGKSTILEAITYALYGNTDRLNQKGDNRNYNMMNLKSSELFIEFIFRTGKDDSEYMATVKGRRNSKQFEDVKVLERKAYKKTESQWLPVETESLDSIIGLSYENFKRTVIIPQGRFQEFLQLGNSDRTKMMKELFNLEKFELYYKVVSLESKNNQEITSLQGQMLQIGEINPEQIKVLEDSLIQLKTDISLKNKELKQHQAEEEKFRKIKDLSTKILAEQQTLSRLKTNESEFILLEKNIRSYEYCLLHFKNLLESSQNSSAKITQYERSIHTDQGLLTAAIQQLKELESGFSALKTAFDNRETILKRAEELDKISKIHELDAACKQINERIANGEKVISQTVEKINELKESKDTLTVTINGIKEQMPDMALLSKVKDWFTINMSLLSTQKEITFELKDIQKNILNIDNQKMQLWENDTFTDHNKSDIDKQNIEVAIENKKVQFKNRVEVLNSEIEHLSVQTKLEEYAANLEEGKPCPLCGALTHPQPFNAQSVSEALLNLRQQKINAESSLTTLDDLQKELSALTTTLQIKKEQLDKTLQKQKDHDTKIAEHQILFIWDMYQEEKSVIDAFELAEKLQKQLKFKETELDTTTKNQDKEIIDKEKFNHALEEFRHQLTSKATEITTLTGQIILHKLEDFRNTTTEELKSAKDASLLQYKDIEIAYSTANDKINALQKERDTLSGRLDVNRLVLAQENLQKKIIEDKIKEKIEQSEYNSLTDIETILSKTIDIESAKTKLTNFRQSLDLSEKQLTAFQKELGDQKYDEKQHQQMMEIVRLISEDLTLSNQNQGKLESNLEKLKVDYESCKTLMEKARTLQLRAEDLKTLKQLFKASGFVNYISSVYLQELCHSGNERFYKLTRQKLSLEVTEDNNFQVRDFMNGGKARNVKTLSGGQTFQAALSLALALADNIQKITQSNQNFFFLDEGFGSLDKESLDVVFETLKSLRKENRIVGVISHVEEMQQEIDTHLKIINHEERGSIIKASWE